MIGVPPGRFRGVWYVVGEAVGFTWILSTNGVWQSESRRVGESDVEGRPGKRQEPRLRHQGALKPQAQHLSNIAIKQRWESSRAVCMENVYRDRVKMRNT